VPRQEAMIECFRILGSDRVAAGIFIFSFFSCCKENSCGRSRRKQQQHMMINSNANTTPNLIL
jgi:hypothetical protein